MSQSTRHQTWENFLVSVLEPGGIHSVAGTPATWIFADRPSGRVGIRIAVAPDVEVPACLVAALDLRLVALAVGPCLELSCRNQDLNRQFYSLALDVADAVQLQGQSPGDALAAAISQWEHLLRFRRILTNEQQVGLYGELWLLRRLLDHRGPIASEAWLGPRGEPHDFRWDDVDVEVKTSTSPRRCHIINRLTQLETAPGRRLFILSLLIQPAGGAPGSSLTEAVAGVRQVLGTSSELGRFNELLATVGYREEDEPFYRNRWCLRAAPSLVPVDHDCPRLTSPQLALALGPLAVRVDDVSYRVDLEGLGWLDPNPRFLSVID